MKAKRTREQNISLLTDLFAFPGQNAQKGWKKAKKIVSDKPQEARKKGEIQDLLFLKTAQTDIQYLVSTERELEKLIFDRAHFGRFFSFTATDIFPPGSHTGTMQICCKLRLGGRGKKRKNKGDLSEKTRLIYPLF